MNVDLDRLGEPELLALNRLIVDRLRVLREARAQAAMCRFNVGDRVSFLADTGNVVCGTLIRHNRKSVTIQADDGLQWRVSPGLLNSIVDVEVMPPASPNVVPLLRRP